VVLTSILLLASVAFNSAQDPSATRPQFAEKLRENNEKLQQYTYKRRLEITIKDHTIHREELVHYVDGKIETVPLETPQGTARQSQAPGLRGVMIRKKIQKKKEEAKKEVEQLRELLKQYSPGSPSFRKALEKAVVSRTDAAIKVEAKGVVQPADSFTLTWSVADQRPQRIEIRSALDKKPVQMTIDYASLPDGPFYPARTVLVVPKKDLTVSIESLDFSRSSEAQ
jgi:hypothetical protein